jgi:hypothetical protein
VRGELQPQPVSFPALPAEDRTVKSRNPTHDDAPSDGGDLENWLHELTDGETTARRLRKRLVAGGRQIEGHCTVCTGTATGKVYFGPDGHLPGRHSA